MRTFKRGWRGATVLAFISTATVGLIGLLAEGPVREGAPEATRFASAEEAYRAGIAKLGVQDIRGAVPALEFAADRGVLGAQLRLAGLHASEDTEHRDLAKALVYYRMVVSQYGGLDRLHPAAKRVSDAYRGLARLYLDGVADIGLKPNPRKALRLLRLSASYFRDPQAQFVLGKIYAEGNYVARNRRLAIRWLLKASQKKHAPSQAYLGEMLMTSYSSEIMRARGLALLALAMENAAEEQREYFDKHYQEIGLKANAKEIDRAKQVIAGWARLGSAEKAMTTMTAHMKTISTIEVEDAEKIGGLVVSKPAPFAADTLAAASPDRAITSLAWGTRLPLLSEDIAVDVLHQQAAASAQVLNRFFEDRSGVQRITETEDLFRAIDIGDHGTFDIPANASLTHRSVADADQARPVKTQ